MADIQAVLSALDVFNGAPDKATLDSANSWLQDFQHSPEAWSTCNVLLVSHDAPIAAKIFAAQTFRTKVTYDLNQVDAENHLALRDTLLGALQTYHAGPRTIIVQLSLAISGLALQLPAWGNPVADIIEAFGRNPTSVPALLQFLTLLPEEVNTNTRIPITDEEYHHRAPQLLTRNANKVMNLLAMYVKAEGVTTVIQNEAFMCLRSWLFAGEIVLPDLLNTALFRFIFDSLKVDDLFDSAIDVLCEMIHETQEIQDNLPVIKTLLPHVIDLRSQLNEQRDDPEKIRGYAHLFSEAGETYRLLLVNDPDGYYPLIDAIGECSAYPDLDIVPITFPFWMRVAQMLGKKTNIPLLFKNAYKSLVAVIIKHLHFPPDIASLVGQEAENFRSFRHVMGDTLKDCCAVLRADYCLLSAYEMITSALARGPDVTWQEIEAPLFAMRSMGAEVDTADQSAVPKIMDLIPQLPNHPRVRYAALLIIARYTEWINAHPEYIPFQLQYISAGFEDTDPDVIAAAGQSLKYMCQDCRQHLVDFLPELHTFLKNKGSKLAQDDRRQVYEAIAYVISAMPMDRAAESLKTFSLDILSQIHDVTVKPLSTKEEMDAVSYGLENLEIMLHVIRSFGDELPAACQNSCGEAWTVFDNFLSKYGTSYELAERATRVIRHGITLFGIGGLEAAASVVTRMSQAFDATGIPSYIWIAGKIVASYGNDKKNVELQTAIKGAYVHATKKVVEILQVKPPGDIPDVLEDYIQMLLQLLDITPDIFFDATVFPSVFRACLAGLTVIQTDIIFASLDLFRAIVSHECVEAPHTSPDYTTWGTLVMNVVAEQGLDLTGYLLSGLIGDFPEDATTNLVSIFRVLAINWPQQLLGWLPNVLRQLPATSAPVQAKSQFMEDLTVAINTRHIEKVKYAIISFNRASRKARDRRRFIGGGA